MEQIFMLYINICILKTICLNGSHFTIFTRVSIDNINTWNKYMHYEDKSFKSKPNANYYTCEHRFAQKWCTMETIYAFGRNIV